MTSDKKAQANRRNSLKSTGPKTPKGKAAVRHNAVKHGLLSQDVLLPGEDEATLKELAEQLRAQLQPSGELESLLVDRIIASHWRLRRLGRVEVSLFAWLRKGGFIPEVHQAEGDTAEFGLSFATDASEANAFSKLSRYETAIERSLYKALHELQRLQAARRPNGNVLPPVAIDVDVSGISREEEP